MLLRYSWKLFMKIFMKVVAVRRRKWKVFQKQTFRLTSTITLLLRCSTEKQTLYKYQNNSLYFSHFFSNFLSFDSSVFIFSVFCISSNNRSSYRRCSEKKVFLEILQNLQENTCARVSFFNKSCTPQGCNFIKKSIWRRRFPVRTPFLQNTLGRLFL